MWKWFMCLLTTRIVQAIEEGAIAIFKAYYLRNKSEQVGGLIEEGFKDITGREQHSSGNTGQ